MGKWSKSGVFCMRMEGCFGNLGSWAAEEAEAEGQVVEAERVSEDVSESGKWNQ